MKQAVWAKGTHEGTAVAVEVLVKVQETEPQGCAVKVKVGAAAVLEAEKVKEAAAVPLPIGVALPVGVGVQVSRTGKHNSQQSSPHTTVTPGIKVGIRVRAGPDGGGQIVMHFSTTTMHSVGTIVADGAAVRVTVGRGVKVWVNVLLGVHVTTEEMQNEMHRTGWNVQLTGTHVWKQCCTTTRHGVKVGVTVAELVAVEVTVAEEVAVEVTVAVVDEVAVTVAVAVAVPVTVEVPLTVAVAVWLPEAVGVPDLVGVNVIVKVSVHVAVSVGVNVSVGVPVGVHVAWGQSWMWHTNQQLLSFEQLVRPAASVYGPGQRLQTVKCLQPQELPALVH